MLEGRIYVLGGYDGAERLRSVECFTPGQGPNPRLQWHRVADMLEPRSNFSVAVMEGRLVVTGGFRQEEGEEGSVCAEVEVYCPATNRFLPIGSPQPIHQLEPWQAAAGGQVRPHLCHGALLVTALTLL